MNDEFKFSTGMPSDDMAEYLQMFVDETSEQLEELVEVLLVLENSPNSPSHLNESFRLIHSIKGAAAMMGLDSITLLTHHLENHFEHLRSGLRTLDRPMMNLILRCVDFLREAVGKLREGKPLVSSPELIEQLAHTVTEVHKTEVAAELASVSKVTAATIPMAEKLDIASQTVNEHSSGGHASVDAHGPRIQKRVIAYLDRGIELPELKAELILARLSDLAVIGRTSPDIDQLESLAELRTLQIWLESPCSDDDLRRAADIVGVELIEIDDVLSSDAVVESRDDGSPLGPVEDEGRQRLPVSEVQATALLPMPSLAEHTAIDSAMASESHSKVVETVRVDIQRLDRLMNLAGELVVNRARFVQLASQMTETFKKSGLFSQLRDLCETLREQLEVGGKSGASAVEVESADDRNRELQTTVMALEEQLHVLERGRRSFVQLNEAIDQFSRVSDGLQRGVLDTRMVPVGPLFNRFKRTVRDISNEMGKKVNLVIRGENTELDKRMIDELGDPLVHLVRNAIDHGLESEEVRRNRGKPETGTLTLEAVHSGNNVLITISDDGGGIHTDRVKLRAIERGLVTSVEAELMSDHDIAQFIWAPGFSTAEVVSDISGRGVGMDIVKTRIGKLNGTVEVDSTVGRGTQFVIRLPLTLAIIRSLLFQLTHGTFAAPIENVREIVSVHGADVITVHGRDSIEVRGEFIPLIRIEDVFDWHGTSTVDTHDRQGDTENGRNSDSVLILTTGFKSMGLVVSELRGCQDIVVKSLDENFTHIRGLAGASILGDGSVCLLLDVVSCLELARQRLRDRTRNRMTSTT